MELNELRKLLVGVRWDDFYPGGRTVTRNGIQFRGRYGVYLNRPSIVIIADGKFIAVRQINISALAAFRRPVLNPYDPTSGEPFKDCLEWIKENDPPLELVLPNGAENGTT